MGDEKIDSGKWIMLFFKIALIGLSVLATVKITILATEIDEQYAVTMAYRMAGGEDRMFLEMWEPHQTSGFLTFLLIRIYMSCTGGVDALVIWLRIAGAVLQAVISLFLYFTMKKYSSSEAAFVMAVFFYNTLPKCSQIPDFSNMQVWFSVLTFLCLLRYFGEEEGRLWWIVLAGIATSLLVLSYPTCVLVLLPIYVGFWKLRRSGRHFGILAGTYTGTCMVCALGYLGYFLSHMTAAQFLQGLQRMTQDRAHSLTWLDKVLSWRTDIIKLFPHTALVLGIALVIWFGCSRFFREKRIAFLVILFCIACYAQIYLWLFENYYFRFSYLLYPILYAAGLYRYFKRERFLGEESGNAHLRKAVFWFGSVSAIALFAAAGLASNTPLYESGMYLMVGLLASVDSWEYERKNQKAVWFIAVLTLLGVTLFMKGFMIYGTYGNKDNVFVVKQKALSGPLKGVYCRYSDGFAYNETAALLDRYVPRGSKVLYIGVGTIIYLQGEYEVCNFSTISTPTFDDTLFEYWDLYPEKRPEYILWSDWVPEESGPSEAVKNRLLEGCDLLAEAEYLTIYKVGEGL